MSTRATASTNANQAWLRLMQSAPRADTVAFEMRAFLDEWSRTHGWRACVWIPDRDRPVLGRDVAPRALGRWRLADLKPGELRRLSFPQSPRLDPAWHECFYRHLDRATPGARGVLRFLIPAGEPSPDTAAKFQESDLSAAAALCVQALVAASVWLEERVRAEQEHGALELGLRMGGLMHDMRNRLTLLSMQQQRMSQDPRAAEQLAGPHEQLMAELRAMCAALVPEQPGGVLPQRIELRPLLMRIAKQAPGLVRRLRGEAMAGIRLRCRSDLFVFADPILLSRTLENLLVNALEASRAEQTVSLSASGTERSVTLEVSDPGRGMDANALARAYQVGRGGEHGTGFGSVSLLAALEDMQGELHVDSAPGRGTRARLVLQQPFDWDAALLVDPDARRRRAWVARLRRHGVQVQGLARASAAIRAMGDANPRALYVVRGIQDAHLQDLLPLAETQGCPVWVLGSRGIAPLAETQHAS